MGPHLLLKKENVAGMKVRALGTSSATRKDGLSLRSFFNISCFFDTPTKHFLLSIDGALRALTHQLIENVDGVSIRTGNGRGNHL